MKIIALLRKNDIGFEIHAYKNISTGLIVVPRVLVLVLVKNYIQGKIEWIIVGRTLKIVDICEICNKIW